MENHEAIVGVFDAQSAAETAIENLVSAGFTLRQLSVIGKGYLTEENVAGSYNSGDGAKFWGGLWGLFADGVFLGTPGIGRVMVLGYLAAIVVSGDRGAVIADRMSAIGAAMYGIGIPKDSAAEYERELMAGNLLLLAHGTPEEVERACVILDEAKPSRLDVYAGARQIGAPQHNGAAV